jgi:hypothetical protein
MQPRKIYKIRSSQNNIVTRFLPDWILACILSLIPSVLVYLVSSKMFELKITNTVSIFLAFAGFSMYLAKAQRDGIPLYQFMFRAFNFARKPKYFDVLDDMELETSDLKTTTQNLPFVRLYNKIETVLKITPVDYMLIREDEKQPFVGSLMNFLNGLDGNVQFYLHNRHLEPVDLLSLTNSMKATVESSFDNQEEGNESLRIYNQTINDTVKKHNITILTIYLIIPMECQTNEPLQLVKSIDDLARRTNRIITNLSNMKYKAKLLNKDELDSFLVINNKLNN